MQIDPSFDVLWSVPRPNVSHELCEIVT
jgi:hypothetical protein